MITQTEKTPSSTGPQGPGAGAPDMAAALAAAGKVMADMGDAMAAILCAVGVRLGLFGELAESGPVTGAELAVRSGLDERAVQEWLNAMASAGYLEADRAAGRFSLPPALAMVLAHDGSPLNLAPGYRMFTALAEMAAPVAEAFRTDGAVTHASYPADFYDAMEQMSAGWLRANLVQVWIPALEGLDERLRQGGRAADIGCGHGLATILCAEAYPQSRFVGYDTYGANVERARRAAAEADVADRVSFVQADAADELTGYHDLVTAFSVLHDAPDPARLLSRVRRAVDPNGVLLILENNVAEEPLDNTGPMATILYTTSVLYCLPTARANGSPGLGTLGLSPGRIREYCAEAGFRSVRPLPSGNPFNAVYEVRP